MHVRFHPYRPHFSHSSTNIFPWSSDNKSLEEGEMGGQEGIMGFTKAKRLQRQYSLRSTLGINFKSGFINTTFSQNFFHLLLC